MDINNKKKIKKISPLYKKVYKIVILLNGWPDAYISPAGNYNGFIISLWKLIKQKLDLKNIKYKETYIRYKNNLIDWTNMIQMIEKGTYDMLIAGVWINSDRIKNVNFTYPLFMKKQLIIYNIKENATVDYVKWLTNLLSLWLMPFIALLLISIILSFVLNHTNKITLKQNIANTIEGFFGQTSGMMFDIKDHHHFQIFRVFILTIVLTFHLYIASTSASESVIYLQNSNKLEYTLKDQKILVSGPTAAKIVKKKGGIPIVTKDDLFQAYIQNQYSGINGFLSGGENLEMLLCNHTNLKISNLDFGYEICAFPINKKNILFKNQIDAIIIQLRDSGSLKKTCDEYSPGKDISTAC